MAKSAKWTLGSYSRFIRTAREREGISVPEARKLYRELRGMYERPMFANDLRKPVIRDIAHSEAIRIQQGTRETGQFAAGSIIEGLSGGGSFSAPVTVIHSLSEWNDLMDIDYDDDMDWDYYEFEGTGEYEED